MIDYPNHPIAECYPPPTTQEFEDLKEDIRVNKLIHPIVLYEGKKLCGIQRARACKELGIEPAYITPKIDDPVTYAISDNEKRRHFNQSKKALIAETLANLKWGSNQYQNKRSLSGEGSSVRREIAKKVGASVSMLEKVRIVKVNGGKHFVDAIRDGKLPAEEAYKISRLPKEEHETALKAAIEKKVRLPRSSKGTTTKAVYTMTAEEKARTQELAQRSKCSIPWPEGTDPYPVHSEGEIRTRQIRDAVVRLRKAEPHIGNMPLGEALRNVFSDTKKIRFFDGTIDSALKAWNHKINGKARARELLLEESRKRRDVIQTDKDNKSLARRHHKIHGFGAAWLRFERALKTALQKSVFVLEDEEQLVSATTAFLTIHFETLRQKAAKPAKQVNQDASGEG
jgi:ParB-like chromosome segregation protein Spo0J